MNDNGKTKRQLQEELALLRRRVAELEAQSGQPGKDRPAPPPEGDSASDVFRFAASHAFDHILIQDRDLRYTFVLNPQLGMTEADIIGKTDREILAPADAARLFAVKRTVLETGEPYDFATTLPNSSGGIEHFDGTYIPRRNAAGQVDGLVGYFRNVTRQNLAQEALRKSEERFRALADVAPAGVYLTDAAGKCRFANRRWLEIAGLTLEESLGDGWADGVHPDDRRAIFSSWRRMVESHGRWGLEYRFRTREGKITWVYGLAAPLRDAAGEIAGYVGINTDITASKRAEVEAQESETRYRALFDSIDEGFCIVEMLFDGEQRPVDYRFLEVNGAFERQTGIKGVVGKRVREVIPDNEEHWFQTYGRIALTGQPERFQNYVAQLGRWFDVFAFRVGRPEDRRVAILFNDFTERKLAEDAMHMAQERLAMAADAAQVGLYELNVQTREAAWTRQHDVIFGMPPSGTHDMTPHHYREFAERVYPDDLPGVEQTIRDALEGRKPYRAEYRIVRPDGEIRWVVARGTAEYDAEGRAAHLRGTVTDITERKLAEDALREASEFNQQVIASAQEGVIVYGPDLRYQVWNPYMERLTGIAAGDVLGRRAEDLFPVLREAGIIEKLKKLLAGEAAETNEFPYRIPQTGRTGWVADSSAPLHNAEGEIIGVIGLVRDITARKLIEEELIKARDAAEAANRAKSEFLANMSHEIRTPMTAILGLADFLLCGDDTTAEQREHLEIIQRNGQALLELINAILDLAKIESGGVDAQRRGCSAVAVVDEVVSLLSVQARKKGLALEAVYQYPLPETVQTDPARLRQALLNLAGNAIKFTEGGGVRISVSLADGADRQRCLQFAIRDTGIGIAPADRDKLFKPFSQVDSTLTRKYGGSGLGLVISRHFARTLGGDIGLESQLGLGSTFTLRIDPGPLDGVRMLSGRPAASPSERPADAVQRFSGRALVVEDGVDNQRVIRLLLEKAGLTVDVSENGLEACRKATCSVIEEAPYELIFMDIHMPAMDGYEATARLRQLGWKRPIVAVTANAMAGDREKCLAAGCDEYLPKPVTQHDLLAMAARFLPSHDRTPV